MKLKVTIFLGVAFLLSASTDLTAQLLEDTEQRLKTVKRERRGLRLFQKKGKSTTPATSSGKFTPAKSLSFGKTSKGKPIKPRFSPGSPFQNRLFAVSPRYSPGSPFKNKLFEAKPRYSRGSPFPAISFRVSPRYSPSKPFVKSDFIVNTRFSPSKPFTKKDFVVNPRYSPSKPFTKRDFVVNPRYSPGKPFTKKDLIVNPRYSTGMPFTKRQLAGAPPRYSAPNPFGNRRIKVIPRYSTGMPFTKDQFRVAPRYSPGNPFAYKDFKVKPRYSNTLTFNLYLRQLWQSMFPNRFMSSYLGPVLVKHPNLKKSSSELASYMGPYKFKPVKSKDLHPSYKYKRTILIHNDLVRAGYKQWNIFWVKINRNQELPKGVKGKVSKPKFDRKERLIWNN